MDNRHDYSDLDADKMCSEVLNELGCAFMSAGDLDEAHRVLAKAVAANTDNPCILANYAIAAGEKGDASTLRKYLNRALEEDQASDSPLISGLLQEAMATACGDVILDVLRANGRISHAIYTQLKTTRQRNAHEQGSGTETVRIEYNGIDPDSLRNLVNAIREALPNLHMDMYANSDTERAADEVVRQSDRQDPDRTRLGTALGRLRALLGRAGNQALSAVLTAVIDQELARLGLAPAG